MTAGCYEVMAPVGSRESLAAAVRAHADSVYFGVGRLNMRARSSNTFSLDDMRDIARLCRRFGIKSYLTLNTVIYDGDMRLMREIADKAADAGVGAVIATDVAVMRYCRERKRPMEVHLSTGLNISNIEALAFYSEFADAAVLARELSLEQVKKIHEEIVRRDIRGPKGDLMKIEMFCHGALCMAVSGKCYLSLMNEGQSANRGECLQLCRRAYTVTDKETGVKLDIDREYIMSPKDLKTIRFLDKMIDAGVSIFKIEGRARGADYVSTVVTCYREALEAAADGTMSEEKKDEWDSRLAKVFNRGFWDGYYLGQTLGEWNERYGGAAERRKIFVGVVTNYFSRLGVAETRLQAADISAGETLMVTGPTTGCLEMTCPEIRLDDGTASATAPRGSLVSIKTTGKVRRNDKLFKIITL